MHAGQAGHAGRQHRRAVIGIPAADQLLLLRLAAQLVVIPDQLGLGFVAVAARCAKEHARHGDGRALEQFFGAFDGHIDRHAVERMEEGKTAALRIHRR